METFWIARDQVLGLKFIAMDLTIMDISNMIFMKVRAFIYGIRDSIFSEISLLGK